MLTTSGRLRTELPVTTTNFVGNALAVPILLVLMVTFSEPALPTTPAATWSLVAVCGFYVSALLLMFAAIKVSGAVVTALILNLEPLVSILTAAVLLGETLTPSQYGGSALVLAALVLATWKPRRRIA
jgi:drug/metabolite transporter (DMT)-like permease